MFKRLFSFSNPLGIALTATAIILSMSPQARRGTRKMFVKGAAALLSVGDQIKVLTIGARKELGTIVNEAKVEKDQMTLPDFSEMMKNMGESTKTKMNQVFDDMKTTVEKVNSGVSHNVEASEELMANTMGELNDKVSKSSITKKASAKSMQKNKAHPTTADIQNVLSSEKYNSLKGNPPIN